MTSTTEWITPLQASLEISVRRGYFVSPDDLKQLRKSGKIDKQYVRQASTRLTLYDRAYIVDQLPTPTKHKKSEPPARFVADWLENCPETIGQLLREGFAIPHLSDAQTIIQARMEKRKMKTNRGRYSPKKDQKESA